MFTTRRGRGSSTDGDHHQRHTKLHTAAHRRQGSYGACFVSANTNFHDDSSHLVPYPYVPSGIARSDLEELRGPPNARVLEKYSSYIGSGMPSHVQHADALSSGCVGSERLQYRGEGIAPAIP